MNTPSIAAVAFTYMPYMAVFGFLAAWMYRWGILRNDRGPRVGGISAASEGALLIGFSTLVVGHVTTALAPGAMRALMGDLERVAVIETVGLVGAMLFSWGVGARLRQRWAALRAGVPQQETRVLVLALLLLSSLLGIYLTVRYRWITAWYAYVSVPYVRSLFVMEPQPASIVASPFAVQLHVLVFMALVASWPMAGLDWEELFPVKGVARRIAEAAPAAPGEAAR
ncbi:MAG: respiratory nitrate reductase subunit gamma [Myxococcales bacterium]|nr:respiratory nitrate reductase subunit gamma [Myxococcales bacterium]